MWLTSFKYTGEKKKKTNNFLAAWATPASARMYFLSVHKSAVYWTYRSTQSSVMLISINEYTLYWLFCFRLHLKCSLFFPLHEAIFPYLSRKGTWRYIPLLHKDAFLITGMVRYSIVSEDFFFSNTANVIEQDMWMYLRNTYSLNTQGQ